MSSFRPLAATFVRRPRTLFPARTLSSKPRFQASQGYGDGKGDPKGEKPQEQGNPSTTTRAAEHPGPAPPAEGQRKSDVTKSPSGTHEALGGKRQFSTSAAFGNGEPPQAKNGAKPKLHTGDIDGRENQSPEKKAEVDQHNKEFDEKHDKPAGEGVKVDQS